MFERVKFRLRQHLLDPDDVAALLIKLGERGFDLVHDFRSVGRAGAQHDLYTRIDEMQRLQQVRQTLLPGDAADEQERGLITVDVVTFEHLPARIVVSRDFELAHGDAVVHHDHLVGIKIRICGQDVLAHAGGHGDDAVGVLVCVTFSPRAQVVAAAQLLTLPWAERFEGMRGDDQRRSVQHLGKVSGQACIPRVRVDNVGVHIVGDLQIDAERLQRAVCFLEFLGNVVSDDLERTFRIVTRDFGNLVFGTWSVKCTNRHIHTFRQNLGKLLCVHACAAVHLGRIFTGKDVNLHICALLFESGSCSTTTVRQISKETPDCFIRVTKFCIFSKNANKEVNKPRTNSVFIRDSHAKAGLHPSIGCSHALRSSPYHQTAVPF